MDYKYIFFLKSLQNNSPRTLRFINLWKKLITNYIVIQYGEPSNVNKNIRLLRSFLRLVKSVKNKNLVFMCSGFMDTLYIYLLIIVSSFFRPNLIILDIGDPWNNGNTNLFQNMFEKYVLRKVDLLIVTNVATMQYYHNIYRGKIVVIEQGVDCGLVKNYSLNCKKFNKEGKIIGVYTGRFYKDIRDPKNFFYAIKECAANLKDLEFIFIGDDLSYYFENIKIAKEFNNLKYYNKLPHEEALKFQAKADFLIYFGNKSSLQIPGKLYEYLIWNKLIIAILYPDSIESELLKSYPNVVILENDINDIKRFFNKNIIHKIIENLNTTKSENFPREFCWEYKRDKLKRILMGIYE
ncbi:hypothetical protein [Lutibacter sp.]